MSGLFFPSRSPSIYSISTDYAPTNPFNEDGDSVTSLGLLQTPPHLREAIRHIFDGEFPTPFNVRAHSDSHTSGPGSPLNVMSNHVPAPVIGDNLREGETFGDRQNRLLAAAASPAYPPMPEIDGRPWSEQDKQYDLEDTISSRHSAIGLIEPSPTHGSNLQTNPPVVNDLANRCWDDHIANSFNSTYAAGFPNPTILDGTYHADDSARSNHSMSSVGLDVRPPLTAGMIAATDPSPQSWPSQDAAHNNIATSISSWPSIEDNSSDSSYVPPKPAKKRLRVAAEQVSKTPSHPAKPCLRDARGRFISARSHTLIKAIDMAPPDVPTASASRPTAVETAANTFFNSLSASPEFNFGFGMPDPLQAHLSLNMQPPTLPASRVLPVSGGNLTPDDPRIQFRAAFLQLSKVLDTFIKSSNPSRHDWGDVCTISEALFTAQKFYIDSCRF
ncbi:hypothetical protein PtB15_6B605 [Puccinia triticina]|nr:hypothetical protein PtB15_6B605 [Puccinia triticina]